MKKIKNYYSNLYSSAKLDSKTIVGEKNGKKITLEELLKTGKTAFLKQAKKTIKIRKKINHE